MNERQEELIHLLLTSEGNTLDSNSLSQKLNCCEKTVRNDIPLLREYFAKYYPSIKLEGHRGLGYRIICDDKSTLVLAKKSIAAEKPQISPEIGLFIDAMVELILTNNIHNYDSLATSLGVNRKILSRELKRWDSILHESNVMLDKRPNLRIKGSELNTRLFLVNSVCTYASSTVLAQTHRAIKTNKATSYKQIIDFFSDLHDIHLTDNAICQAIVYLYVTITRIKLGKTIIRSVKLDKEAQQSATLPYYDLANYIKHHFNVLLSRAEYETLEQLFLLAEQEVQYSNYENKRLETSVIECTNAFLALAHIDSQSELITRMTFSQQISLALQRRKANIHFTNFDLNEILEQDISSYIYWYDIADKITQNYVGKLLNDDLSKLAILLLTVTEQRKQTSLQIGVIVNASDVIKQYCLAKLQQAFPEHTFFYPISNTNLEENKKQVDMYISTVAIDKSIPRVLVSQAINDQDIKRIETQIEAIQHSSKNTNHLEGEITELHLHKKTIEEILEILADEALANNIWTGSTPELHSAIFTHVMFHNKTVFSIVYSDKCTKAHLYDIRDLKSLYIHGQEIESAYVIMCDAHEQSLIDSLDSLQNMLK